MPITPITTPYQELRGDQAGQITSTSPYTRLIVHTTTKKSWTGCPIRQVEGGLWVPATPILTLANNPDTKDAVFQTEAASEKLHVYADSASGDADVYLTNVSGPGSSLVVVDNITINQLGQGGGLQVIPAGPTPIKFSGAYQAAPIPSGGFFLWEGTANSKLYGDGKVTFRPLAFCPPLSVLSRPRVLGMRLQFKGVATADIIIGVAVTSALGPGGAYLGGVTIPAATYANYTTFDVAPTDGTTLPWLLTPGSTDFVLASYTSLGDATSAFLLWQLYLG